MGIEDTKDTKFTCKICKQESDKLYESRVRDVCEYCIKRDEPTRGETLE